MRTIKFRGRHISSGCWVYGNLIQGEINGKRFTEIEHSVFEDFHKWEVDTQTVGQFVGHDRDGKEVYEGSTVKYEGAIYQIEWYNNGFYLNDFLRTNWSSEEIEVIDEV